VRNERTVFRGAMFVDAGSSALAVDDLRGKTVAWVDRTSAAGYLYPRLELAARGIDAPRFFGGELFLRSHAEVVRAVFDGRADVGATYAEPPPRGEPIRRAGFCDAAPKRSARVLLWTGEIPNDVIAGHGLLSRDAHRTFTNAILTLCEREHGRQLLFNAFHAEQFASMPRNSLRPIWDLVRLAREHGLLHYL
jgi:phosphonate transport system substrate-binding protein